MIERKRLTDEQLKQLRESPGYFSNEDASHIIDEALARGKERDEHFDGRRDALNKWQERIDLLTVAREERDEAREQLNELREDKARLDFIISNNRIDPVDRDAIDAARGRKSSS